MKVKNKGQKDHGPELDTEDNDRANIIQKYWRAFLSRQ